MAYGCFNLSILEFKEEKEDKEKALEDLRFNLSILEFKERN